MKTIIIYAGKNGTTSKCAKMLSEKLNETDMINLNELIPNIAEYDSIIIGSHIRIGKFHPKVKEFIKDNRSLLLHKKCAYFICCGLATKYEEYFKGNIDEELLSKAVIYNTFGGQMDIEKLKGLDKFIVSMVKKTKEGKETVEILENNINEFAKKIKEVI